MCRVGVAVRGVGGGCELLAEDGGDLGTMASGDVRCGEEEEEDGCAVVVVCRLWCSRWKERDSGGVGGATWPWRWVDGTMEDCRLLEMGSWL